MRDGWTPKVGDIVRIRDWNDMESEFGLHRDVYINIPFKRNDNSNDNFWFVPEMRSMCGQEFEITKLRKLGNSEYSVVEGHQTPWIIITPCVEPAIDIDEYDLSDIYEFLDSITIIGDRGNKV